MKITACLEEICPINSIEGSRKYHTVSQNCCSSVASVGSYAFRPYRLKPARLLCPCGSPARILERVAMSSAPGDLPNSEFKPTSPALQADSLPLSPRGSP